MRSRRPVVILILAVIITLVILFGQHAGPYGSADYFEPRPAVTTGSHPVQKLITEATNDFDALRTRQSKTLSDAAAEYRRRYKLPPPPYFDKWYAFAKKRKVQLIDEYDTIFHQIQPFWALPPKTIRERVRESIGFDNGMIAMMIRNGQVSKVDGGGDGAQWHREALENMVANFVAYLPDMDMAFNIHDEPRVVLQHDDLSRHVEIAQMKTMPAALNAQNLKNGWSRAPTDLGDGNRIKEYRTTRFNVFAHQPTWTNSRMSCSPHSAARSLDDNATDDTAAYSIEPLGFVQNTTAFSDICNSPSMARTFGFFDRPNAFKITHDLFPVFSQSKISALQDILYPSPWYWANRVVYPPERDMDWESKVGALYWRGSTTGGFSRDGGWRRQHRQLFVQKTNKPDTAKILERVTPSMNPEFEQWMEKEIPRSSMNASFDVKFTYIGQCDPGDCDAQKEYFEVVQPVDQFDAFKFKYLLDIDGNAFSGRYYAFLLSKSLVYKLAVFREWHDELLKAWVHYVPLGLKGEEYVESVRYFDQEDVGRIEAKRIAEQGRGWAGKALRKDDMEVWFFRLLLEYGRLVDESRQDIGYIG